MKFWACGFHVQWKYDVIVALTISNVRGRISESLHVEMLLVIGTAHVFSWNFNWLFIVY
jgi:hypothetical protein